MLFGIQTKPLCKRDTIRIVGITFEKSETFGGNVDIKELIRRKGILDLKSIDISNDEWLYVIQKPFTCRILVTHEI